jgi:3-oxoacyl-[acyl-carrier protein] reductase
MMNLDLTGKTAVVCGATQGIGFATAKQLAKQGASIILIARSEERLINAISQLEYPERHSYAVADFSHPQSVKEAIQKVTSNCDVNILVNNTGGPNPGKAIDADIEEFRQAFNAHLICNQILSQAVVDGMKRSGYGRIVNVISTSVKQPLPNLGVSNTIRGAVASWSKTLASELGAFGITVNNVLPGATSTGRL